MDGYESDLVSREADSPLVQLSRRAVVGAAAWSAPVIVVASAAPAFAGSDLNSLVRITPSAATFTADQGSIVQTLTVKYVTAGNAAIPDATINFSSGSSFVSFSPTSPTTGMDGEATTTLTYASSKPVSGTSIVITATVDGTSPAVSTSWTLTYATYAPDVVVMRFGDGAAALGGNATAAFLDRQTQAGGPGSFTNWKVLPTTATAPQRRVTVSGTATAEGWISLSPDRRYLVVAGYDAALGTATVATSTTDPRVAARVSSSGVLDSSTSYGVTNPGLNARGVASADGSAFYQTSNTGMRYTTLGATGSPTSIVASGGSRAIVVVDGQLYMSLATSIVKVGSNLPTGTAATTSLVTGTSDSSQFVLLDRTSDGSGPNLLYVADGTSGVKKFSLESGTWTPRGAVTTGFGGAAVRGLTGYVAPSGTGVALWATTGGALFTLTDATAFNATMSGSATSIQTAANNTAFRGVAFAPTVS